MARELLEQDDQQNDDDQRRADTDIHAPVSFPWVD
jgi:hypothetical protein